jgi:DNA-directed RNA polymerase specialized sigma24 family protein
VKVGRTVYVAATVAVDAQGRLVAPGDMAGQLDAVYVNLAATLKAQGAGFEHVVSERIYTTDMDALLKVDERYRLVLVQFYMEGLTYSEIAAAADIPIGTVMSRISRGRAELREHLTSSFQTEAGKVIPFRTANGTFI